jgi:serine-type D-Ala-D-Ala carboxypeptidase (penicillin-binding protein 5/6)
MRRLATQLPALACVLACAVPASAAAQAQDAPKGVGAPSAIVVEASSGDVLWGRAADKRRPIASTTKLMTALLTLEHSPRLGVRIPAANYVALPVESKLGLRPGERLSIADLLRGLMLESANDAAVTLAEHVGGSRPAFVRMMNRRARGLGLTHTHYANPIGLDAPSNYSSAHDLARLAVRLRAHSFVRRVANRTEVTLSTGARPRKVENRNTLLERDKWVNGLKTGHTLGAGYVLVGSRTRRGVTMVAVVLGTPSVAARNADAYKLLTWGARHYQRVRPVAEGELVATPDIRYRRGAQLDLVTDGSVTRVVRVGSKVTTRDVGVPKEVTGPIRRGAELGRREVFADGKLVAVVPVVASASVPVAGPAQKTKDWFTKPLALLIAVAVLGGTVFVGRRLRRPPRRRAGRTESEAAA